MTKFSAKIFREYDIRGRVGVDFEPAFGRELGRAYGTVVLRFNQKLDGKCPVVAIGWDCRVTSEEIRDNVAAGLQDVGIDPLLCGMGPTPQLYFGVLSKELAGGIQITASHNPGPDNGFKMMIGGTTLSGSAIAELKEIVESGNYALSDDQGQSSEVDLRSEYIDDLESRFSEKIPERSLKVVVDGGNGVGGLVGPELLRRLGCEVIELYTDPDGTFPNHHPDPTVLENIEELRKEVVRLGADVGIAWDGDADRIGVVDETGKPIYGDMLLVLFGRALLKEIPGATIIGDVKCSDLLFEDLNQRGANAVMAKTGHSLIKKKMKEIGAQLAGEMSGHMFFAHNYWGFDDALYAAAWIVQIIAESDESLSSLLSDLPEVVSTPEIRLNVPEEHKFVIAEKAASAFSDYETDLTDGVRIRFADGWGLVRASNTQPALVMRFEAQSEASLVANRRTVEERIAKISESLRS